MENYDAVSLPLSGLDTGNIEVTPVIDKLALYNYTFDDIPENDIPPGEHVAGPLTFSKLKLRKPQSPKLFRYYDAMQCYDLPHSNIPNNLYKRRNDSLNLYTHRDYSFNHKKNFKKSYDTAFNFVSSLQAGSGGVDAFAFTRDPDKPLKLVSAHIVADYIYCDTGSLNLIDLESGDVTNCVGHLQRIGGKEQLASVGSVCVSNSGDLLASCSPYCTKLKMWDCEDGTSLIQPFAFPSSDGLSEVVVAPEEYSNNFVVDLFGVSTIHGPFFVISRLLNNDQYSYDHFKYEDRSGDADDFDGTHLLFGTGLSKDNLFGSYCNSDDHIPNGKINCWDMASPKEPKFTIKSEGMAVNRMAMNADGNLLAFARSDKVEDVRLLVHDIRTNIKRRPNGVFAPFTSQQDQNFVGWSKCGMEVFSAATNNIVMYFDIRNEKYPLHQLEHGPSPWHVINTKVVHDVDGIRTVVTLPSTGHLVTGGEDGEVRIWDVDRADPYVKSLEGPDGVVLDSAVREVSTSQDGRCIAAGTQTGRVYIWTMDHAGKYRLNGT